MQQQQARRPAYLLATGLLAAAAVLTIGNARAACGEQRDFLMRQDPLLAAVRPVDCATLMDGPPQFTWPLQRGHNTYTVALHFPDGHTEQRSTTRNWLAWDHPVPAGEYFWRVSVAGGERRDTSAARNFRIEPLGVPPKAEREAKGAPAEVASARPAPPAAPASNLFRVEPSESWIPAPKPARAPRKAAVGGFFGGFTQ